MAYMSLGAHAQAPVAEAPEESHVEELSRTLIWMGLGISLLMWAVFGFILWIPLMVRATFSFSVSLVHATLTTQTAERAGLVLKDAINFYRRGFLVAIDAIQGNVTADPDEVPRERGLSASFTLNQLAWAVVAWYFMLLFVGIVETSPLDMWRAIAAVPWMGMLEVSADSFRNWVTGAIQR
jgi:hypothetical protein